MTVDPARAASYASQLAHLREIQTLAMRFVHRAADAAEREFAAPDDAPPPERHGRLAPDVAFLRAANLVRAAIVLQHRILLLAPSSATPGTAKPAAPSPPSPTPAQAELGKLDALRAKLERDAAKSNPLAALRTTRPAPTRDSLTASTTLIPPAAAQSRPHAPSLDLARSPP